MSSIQLDVKNSIAFVTLNRPEKLNAFNREMALALQNVLDQVNRDRLVRCICITGAGKAFCAGQDLAEIIDQTSLELGKILLEHYNPIILKIRNFSKPVIAAVNGVAAGAGANIALCCDIVIATKSAAFIQSFSKIGLIPDSSGTYFLPRLVGFQKASALMMLGDKVSAVEAEQMGMIYKAFPDEAFETEFIKIAETLASMPSQALTLIKEAMNNSLSNTLKQQLTLEEHLQQKAGSTFDFKEGITAFVEKRQPDFKGE